MQQALALNAPVMQVVFIPPGPDVLLVHRAPLLTLPQQHVFQMQVQHAQVCRARTVIHRCLLAKNVPVPALSPGTGMDVLNWAVVRQERVLKQEVLVLLAEKIHAGIRMRAVVVHLQRRVMRQANVLLVRPRVILRAARQVMPAVIIVGPVRQIVPVLIHVIRQASVLAVRRHVILRAVRQVMPAVITVGPVQQIVPAPAHVMRQASVCSLSMADGRHGPAQQHVPQTALVAPVVQRLAHAHALILPRLMEAKIVPILVIQTIMAVIPVNNKRAQALHRPMAPVILQ